MCVHTSETTFLLLASGERPWLSRAGACPLPLRLFSNTYRRKAFRKSHRPPKPPWGSSSGSHRGLGPSLIRACTIVISAGCMLVPFILTCSRPYTPYLRETQGGSQLRQRSISWSDPGVPWRILGLGRLAFRRRT